ncbi:ATP-dependent DNA helicase UvrD1 [compost metagenome]
MDALDALNAMDGVNATNTEEKPVETLRPAQAEVLRYAGGKLAIAAVPGAGKTFILTRLACRLIEDLGAKPREILILTFMRSAATTFKRRIGQALRERGLPSYGLQASTIHSFCLSVVKQAYERYGDRDFGQEGLQVLAPLEQAMILSDSLDRYLSDPAARRDWERRYPQQREQDDPRKATTDAARKIISAAKNFRLTPAEIDGLAGVPPELAYLYRHYAMTLRERNAVDYDDQIQEALLLLKTHPALRNYYQKRFRWVMEDEAQDSTPAQNELLELLTSPDWGGSGNLVRVGDSNQAIMASFTFNDPRFFREFCDSQQADGRRVTMDESSRSAPHVLDLANHLVQLAKTHPDPGVQKAFDPVRIQQATAGKANPTDGRVTWAQFSSKDQERVTVLTEVRDYLKAHPKRRAAILCITNGMVDEYAQTARDMGIPVYLEDEAKPKSTGLITLLSRVLALLSLPPVAQPAAFWQVLTALAELLSDPLKDEMATHAWVMKEANLYALFYPKTGFPPHRPEAVPEDDYARLVMVAERLRKLLDARHLPPVELLPTIARELVPDPTAQVIAGKVAAIARTRSTRAPYLPLTDEEAWLAPTSPLEETRILLDEILAHSKTMELLPKTGETRPPQPGEVEIITLHRSKGAEYPAVWIPNLGYLNSNASFTHFPWDLSEIEIRDLERFQAEQAIIHRNDDPPPDAEDLVLEARRLMIAEKLRLLFVGITRAEEDLRLSCYSFKGEIIAPPHIMELAARCQTS